MKSGIKMSSEEKILDIIYKCADELNKQLPEEGRVSKSKSTSIVGNDSVLDSLGLVMFLVNIEEQIRHLDIECNLLDAFTSQSDETPFATIGSMAHWIEAQIS